MRRFKKTSPCPICHGYEAKSRGQSQRCYGFLSDDGNWAHCTREEYAGPLHKNSKSDTYAHLLVGECNCGMVHNPKTAAQTSQTTLKSRITQQYDYRDENSELLYQVCRSEPKGFFQRRPDGKGGWTTSLGDVRRVLYRLQDLLRADKSDEVFICEGEKDCDALHGLGLIATTNSGGAKKWNNEYGETLRGRDVVILPDNDEAGKQHAEHVADSLHNVAASVRILELPGLPDRGDVSDWLAAGGSVERLCDLAKTAPVFEGKFLRYESSTDSTEDWISAADVETEEIEWLWYPYIPLGKITLFDGDPGVGKSFATCAIAAAVSRGNGLPDVEPKDPASVLMLSAEDGLSDTIRPRLDGLGADVTRILLRNKEISLDQEGLEQLERQISKTRPALVVIDPLFAFVGGKTDIYRDNEIRAKMTPLKEIAEKYGCAIVALRHLTKQQQKALYAGGGSIGIIGAARSALLFGRVGSESGFVHIKSNLAESGDAVGFKIDTGQDGRGRFSWTTDCDLTMERILRGFGEQTESKSKLNIAIDFLQQFLSDGPRLHAEVEKASLKNGIKGPTLRRAKTEAGIISFRQKPGIGPWYWKREDDSQADYEPIAFTVEHVDNEGLNLIAAEVSSGVQTSGIEQVNAESICLNDYLDKHDVTSANNILTVTEADAQKEAPVIDELEDDYEERAAILEFDGGLTRKFAEKLARDLNVESTEDFRAA